MAHYQRSTSPVFSRLFGPVAEAYARSARPYDCTRLTDLDFLEMGVLRSLTDSRTGRDFVQRHGDHGRRQVSVDLFFKALKSRRRLANLQSLGPQLAAEMAARCDDPFAGIPELDGFAVRAGDGHYHAAACHDPGVRGSDGELKKWPTGHFFTLDLRSHHLSHLTAADSGPRRKREHDMRAIKRSDFDALRGGEPRGRKVLLAWDRAGIDFGFWEKAKNSAGLYLVSMEKKNMAFMKCGDLPIDRSDPRNAGVTADEMGAPASTGRMLRRVRYTCPVDGRDYSYVTTEMTLPPGVVALVYKQRWDIEKVFDELKTKLGEAKSWGSGATSKTCHAEFLCLAHNLMVILERGIADREKVENDTERGRKEERKHAAIAAGGNWVATAFQRFTVRPLKFIRWLRNHVYREAPWDEAIARLRQIYASF